jgi:hypothetical protein
MSKATIFKVGGILVAICSAAAWTFLPEARILTPEISRWAFLIAIIGIVIGGVMWLSGRKAQTASLSKRHILVTLGIILVLIAIITTVGVLNLRQPQENVIAPQPEQEWLWSRPSPQEIWQDIDKYSPYNQETVRQSYEGLSVTWGVTLFDATGTPDGIDIWAIPIGQSYPGISFKVDASLYPELKTMLRGEEFVVEGTIAKVDTIHIELDNCHLTFD